MSVIHTFCYSFISVKSKEIALLLVVTEQNLQAPEASASL